MRIEHGTIICPYMYHVCLATYVALRWNRIEWDMKNVGSSRMIGHLIRGRLYKLALLSIH